MASIFGSRWRRCFESRGGLATLIAAALVASLHVEPASAQQPAAQPAAIKASAPKVGAILRGQQAPTPDDLKMLDDFFQKYYFPSMITTDPVQLGELAKKRKDLFVQFINVRGSQAAHDHLAAITLNAMGNIAVRDYHPAVRYNATLILGQLDQTVPQPGGPPPSPLARATNGLLALLENADIKGVAVIPPVKVAALVGLERHTRFGVDPQYADRLSAAALAVATRQDSPAGVSPEVNDWMRRLAVKVLANQSAAGLTPAIYDVAVKLIGNRKVNLDDRCGIAESFTTPMYQGAQGIDLGAMALAIGALAEDVLAFEVKEAEKYQRELRGGVGGGGSFGRELGGELGGGFGGGFGGGSALGDEGLRLEKRRMIDRLKAVADAADALGGAAADEVKERMTSLATPIKSTWEAAASNEAIDAGVARSVIDLAQEVGRLTAEWAPPEAAAGEDEAFEEPAAEPLADAGAVEPGAEAAPTASPVEQPAAEAPLEAPPAEEPAAPVDPATN